MPFPIYTDNTIPSGPQFLFDAEYSRHMEMVTKIDLLNAGSVMRSNDGVSPFVDAFTDSTGRVDTVNTTTTTAAFSTNKYIGSGTGSPLIVDMDIPGGTFLSSGGTAYASAKIIDWYSGCNLQWQLSALGDLPSGGPYVVIKGGSGATSNFAINNCKCAVIGTSGTGYVYAVYCTTGTAEVQRAQIYKTLFYGSNGTDYKLSNATYWSGTINTLSTNVARDVGKEAHIALASRSSNGNYSIIGSFANTTTNFSGAAWTNLVYEGTTMNFTMPSGTLLNIKNVSEIGTDTSADEKNNPPQAVIATAGANGTGNMDLLVLAVGSIGFTITNATTSSTRNFSGNGVPVLTSASETLTSGGTGWLNMNVNGNNVYGKTGSFTPLSTPPTKYSLKLISGALANWPSIQGAGVIVL